MSAQGRWFVTPHAVKRYRERIDTTVTYETALSRLVCLSEVARHIRTKTDGTQVWRVGRTYGRLRFNVAPSSTPDALPQMLTVIPPFEAMTPWM